MSKTYRNLFLELGYSEKDIEKKIKESWDAIFVSEDRFYFEVENDMAYITDTGNNDVRTEGMSYGMLMAVLMNRQDIFNRLWKWAHTYMFMREGKLIGYFAWSCALDGKKNAWGPASDGEEFFALALLFAHAKWTSGEGIFNYKKEMENLLSTCLHHEIPMWDLDNYLIKFVPGSDFSDPSYHVPHFYDFFAKHSLPEDRSFWEKAAKASRSFIPLSCHPITGLAPEYAHYDGSPNPVGPPDGHGDFYSDSYRVALNIGVESLWNGPSEALSRVASRILCFFSSIDIADTVYAKYKIDGTPLGEPSLHPTGLIATNAASAIAVLGNPLCTEKEQNAAEKAIRLLWETPPRKGERRYYDNCLHFFSVLALSGTFIPPEF